MPALVQPRRVVDRIRAQKRSGTELSAPPPDTAYFALPLMMLARLSPSSQAFPPAAFVSAYWRH